jgi:hypothetical protein
LKILFFSSTEFGDAYFFCLSKEGDSLYQWRSYTPKGGIAVEFDRVVLFEALKIAIVNDTELIRKFFRFKYEKCRYSEFFARKVVMLLIAHYEKSKGGGCFGKCNKELRLRA